MMFRMSTFSIPYGVAPALKTYACRRNSRARPKICQPRVCSVQLAWASDAPRRMRAWAASGTASPASHRNSGAPMPAITMNQKYGRVWRVGPVTVHASTTCARIMITTARPRIQSM